MNSLSKKRTLAGFTLIEILVTMVVMSIGFLGLAGLQATALRSNSGASFRTQAVVYTNDMAERIRANPTAVTNNNFLLANSPGNIDCTALPAQYCDSFMMREPTQRLLQQTVQLHNWPPLTSIPGSVELHEMGRMRRFAALE